MSFSELLAFTPGSLHAPWGKSIHHTSFESSHQLLKILGSAEVWQYSKLVKSLLKISILLQRSRSQRFILISCVYLESLRHTRSPCAVSFAVPINFTRFLISTLCIITIADEDVTYLIHHYNNKTVDLSGTYS